MAHVVGFRRKDMTSRLPAGARRSISSESATAAMQRQPETRAGRVRARLDAASGVGDDHLGSAPLLRTVDLDRPWPPA